MSIVLASTARNISRFLSTIVHSYNKLKKYQKDIQYVIYENNSTDNTVVKLKEWASQDSSIHIYTETIDLTQFKARNSLNEPCKYEIIAYARNRLLNYLQHHDQDASTVILIDMNNENEWPIESIMKALEFPKDQYDVLICNGIKACGSIVDIFSFRDLNTFYGPEVMPTLYYTSEYTTKSYMYVNHMISIYSGFNGLAIFNRDVIHKSDYSAFPTAELNKGYQNTCDKLIINVDPSFIEKHIGMYMFNTDIFYYNFENFNYPIISPHVSFFAKLHAQNISRVFLCPFLEWKWYKETLIRI